MKRLPGSQVTGDAPAADPAHFTGSVNQLPVHAQPDAHPLRATVVTFNDGARTNWHSHAGGQVLHVISGDGRTQSRGGEVTALRPGDMVVAEAGEEHWHGAAAGATLQHLAISLGAVEWLEPAPGE